MSTETWEDIRNAIIEILKIENTMAGSRVRLGRTLNLSNPYDFISPSDIMPLLIVSLKGCAYEGMTETGSKDLYVRRPDFQIDGYITHNITASEAAGLEPDEWLDQQLDLFAAQVSRAIEKYRRFRGESDPNPLLRLRPIPMWPTSFVKNDMEGTQGELIGVFTFKVESTYQENREFQPLDDLEAVDNKTTTGKDEVEASITKEVTAAETIP